MKGKSAHDNQTSSPASSLSSATLSNTDQNLGPSQDSPKAHELMAPSLGRTHSLEGMMMLKRSLSSHTASNSFHRNRSPSIPPAHPTHYQRGYGAAAATGGLYSTPPGLVASPRLLPQDRGMHHPQPPQALLQPQRLYPGEEDDDEDEAATATGPESKKETQALLTHAASATDIEHQPILHSTMNPAYNAINASPISISSQSTPPTANKNGLIYILVYSLINTIMSVPCLYGYASVIFNHSCFQPYMSTLSKLLIWSSAVHQLIFVFVSTISFAKAEVQDAGLIFLSTISNFIATSILNEIDEDNMDSDKKMTQVISTTLVGMAVATSSLGVILVILGRLGWARVVSFLPLPVVGGYLAFIGYFCVVAGIGLCTSHSGLVDGNIFSDVRVLTDLETFPHAMAGIIAGLAMYLVTRFSTSDAALPITMVIIPCTFYLYLFLSGTTMNQAREAMWVGPLEPPTNIMALFDFISFSEVRWEYIFSSKCFATWFGMTFVVGFSSCLDVAAISMDIGEVLDMNKELATVGFSNVFSGLLLGQTGSYIFSQTLFTYRTGCHTRWVGVFCTVFFLSTVFSSVNFLEITPLFFLGSTLIFIGASLLYEWLVEVRHKLLLSEYLVLLATFVAIQVVGIDAGIIIGVIVAVIDYVITTANVSSLRQVNKRSRAVWPPEKRKILHEIGYHGRHPKIVTLEVKGSVFFGSSLQLLTNMLQEIGVSATQMDIMEMSLSSPRHMHGTRSPAPPGLAAKKKRLGETKDQLKGIKKKRKNPRFVVLDLFQVQSLDASAARGCFLQMVKILSKHGIFVCASGANLRVDWILRSHNVACSYEEEEAIKEKMRNPQYAKDLLTDCSGRLLLFETVHEALEMCENKLIMETESSQSGGAAHYPSYHRGNLIPPPLWKAYSQDTKTPLSAVFSLIIGEEDKNREILRRFDESDSIQEICLLSGETIFESGETSDSFYVVLFGQVGLFRGVEQDDVSSKSIMSGAGNVNFTKQSSRFVSNNKEVREVMAFLQVGGIFGFVDFALERSRSFSAASGSDGTILAEITRSSLERLREEDNDMYYVIEKVLLQTSLMELGNLDTC